MATTTLDSSPTRVPPPGPGGPRIAEMATAMRGSEILRIAAEIRVRAATGERICNLTVGDFDPQQFRIPKLLEELITEGLRKGETNYPPSNGMASLRDAVRVFYREQLGLDYPIESVLITAGSRPGIYGVFRTLLDPGDRVVYPVPSWNNNHYCHLTGAIDVPVLCGPETAFLPTRALLEEAVRGARLLSLNSPLNPTGTAFDADTLRGICDLVVEENARRGPGERPLYVMYDQVYWQLTFGGTRHVEPVGLNSAMAPFTIYVDGISKSFAATGVRVGWVVGPTDVITPMSNFLGHVGAWAPRAEQGATAVLLGQPNEIAAYRSTFTEGVKQRLDALYLGVVALRDAGHPLSAIEPMGAMYLSAQFDLVGKRTADGHVLQCNDDIRRWLLQESGLAVVPFQAFGMRDESGWCRLSAGAVSVSDVKWGIDRLAGALATLV